MKWYQRLAKQAADNRPLPGLSRPRTPQPPLRTVVRLAPLRNGLPLYVPERVGDLRVSIGPNTQAGKYFQQLLKQFQQGKVDAKTLRSRTDWLLNNLLPGEAIFDHIRQPQTPREWQKWQWDVDDAFGEAEHQLYTKRDRRLSAPPWAQGPHLVARDFVGRGYFWPTVGQMLRHTPEEVWRALPAVKPSIGSFEVDRRGDMSTSVPVPEVVLYGKTPPLFAPQPLPEEVVRRVARPDLLRLAYTTGRFWDSPGLAMIGEPLEHVRRGGIPPFAAPLWRPVQLPEDLLRKHRQLREAQALHNFRVGLYRMGSSWWPFIRAFVGGRRRP